jgi:signal transduction histidine kinase/ActR/RegA family two-component response regulator
MLATTDTDPARVLILAPIGRDGPASADLLRRAGLTAKVCANLAEVLADIEGGAVVTTEEALLTGDFARLTAWVKNQPAWSDLSFIVLTSHQEQSSAVARRQRLVASLGNVSLLERPMESVTLTSAVQAAIRARRRQYELRALLEAQQRTARELEALVANRTRKLQETNEELRRQMAERTRIEESLRQRQKMEAVGQLSGGIAHDFNNLLQGLTGSLDLIRRMPKDSERVRRWAEAGLHAAERGARLTGQLLAFSRAQRIEAKPVIVAELVAGLRDLLTRTLGPMIKITFELDSDQVPVLSDPTQLEMAVLNLAINARDAMPTGGELHIATRPRVIIHDPELEPAEYVELSISDTGVGTSADVASRAFDPFFTTKGVGRGTGLGLSQVYGIARQAGGTARVESRLGEGTTVCVLLRRTGVTGAIDTGPLETGMDTVVRSATILVVDDDADVRQFLVDSLDSLGYKVAEAENGRAGLRAIEDFAPDVMVIDFAMPEMSGAEVAKAARARRPKLPIVFASGYSETAAIEDIPGPAAPVLRKPFRVDELQLAIADALQRAVPDGR